MLFRSGDNLKKGTISLREAYVLQSQLMLSVSKALIEDKDIITCMLEVESEIEKKFISRNIEEIDALLNKLKMIYGSLQ